VNKQERKVVVIGTGFVGAAYVYALMHTGLAGEIALIDLGQRRVKGEVMAGLARYVCKADSGVSF
jgi:L-lactate dehydrogenase